jgi:hypothetical protein
MAGIFISYRRADSDGWAGRLRDALRFRFGDLVFQDVDSIPDGEIFSEVIDRALQECDVALVIIGPNWASALDEHGRRRLDLEDDWVRLETAMVLNRNIRVIPVLVGAARLPRADELPEELRSLTKRQAREIRSNSWDSDVAQLMNHLRQIVGRKRRPVWQYATPVLVVLASVVAFVGSRFLGETPPASPVAASLNRAEPAEPVAPEVKPSDRLAAAPREKDAPQTTPTRAPAPPPVAQLPAAPAAERVPDPPRTPAAVAAKATPAPAGATASTAPQRTRESPPQTREPTPKAPPAATQPTATAAAAPRTQDSATLAMARAPAAPTSGPEAITPRAASAEPPAPRAASVEPPPAPRPAPVSPKPAALQAGSESPPERPAVTASVSPKATAPSAGALSFPNRAATARELRVGDSWTYRLRDARAGRDLATVTHEISGGDSAGIRETVRVGERQLVADAAGAGGASTSDAVQRRLALQPRIFELQIDGTVTLFEFSPFLLAWSEPQPRASWSRIPGAGSADQLGDWTFSGRVSGTERVRVAAGAFDAIKVELDGRRDVTIPTTIHVYDETFASQQAYSIWFVPEIGRAVKYERRSFNRARRLLEHEQYELLSYRLR